MPVWSASRKPGKAERNRAHTSPSSIESLLKALTPRRWELLKTLQAEGPMSLRALARRLNRDVKSVHRDVTALKALGLVESTEQGIRVPYHEIEVHLILRAVA